MTGNLTREDWIEAAIRALGRGGPAAVRVDRLARELGISRGSFYWHFENRADLMEALLAEWEAETEGLVERADEAPTPESRLRSLVREVRALGGRLPDAAIFMWARQDEDVARRVAEVEAQRVGYLEKLLREAGQAPDEARRRAEFGYLTFVGLMDRSHRDRWWTPDTEEILDRLVRQMLD